MGGVAGKFRCMGRTILRFSSCGKKVGAPRGIASNSLVEADAVIRRTVSSGVRARDEVLQ